MSLKDNIVNELKVTGGNVHATAQRLGVSDTYVSKVLKETSPDEILKVAGETNGKDKDTKSVNLFQEFRDAVIPPNKVGVITLRDSTLEKLQESLDENKLTDKLKLSLLKVLLEYETTGRALARPIANLHLDQSSKTINVQNIVDKLEQLPTEHVKALRDSAKDVINVTPTEAS